MVYKLLLLSLLIGVSLAEEIKFFQISDLHLDKAYSVNGTYSNRCHDLLNGTVGPGFRSVGDYGCDAPRVLVASAFEAMKLVNPSPDFILWTGDSNPHWFQGGPNFSYIYPNLKNITKLMSSAFPDIPVIPTLGNHDTYRADNYPDFKMSDEQDHFYDKYVEEGTWGDLIPKESLEMFKQCGYYIYPLKFGMKFIVLNTNLYYSNKLDLDYDDPCDQLSWLEKQLDDVNNGEEHVFLAAHVPPGYFERSPDRGFFNINNSANLTKRFIDQMGRDKVKMSFFGHTHTDSYRLFPAQNGTTQSLAFIAPSITPAMYLDHKPYGTNPSFRIYTYDTETGTMKDYSSYYLPLTKVPEKDYNATELAKEWIFGYNATSSFKVQDLSIDNMESAFKEMLKKPEGSVFKQYYKHNTMFNVKPENQTCSAKCHADMVCSMANYEPKGLLTCLDMMLKIRNVTQVTTLPPTQPPTPTLVGEETTTVHNAEQNVVETTLKEEVVSAETTTVKTDDVVETTLPPHEEVSVEATSRSLEVTTTLPHIEPQTTIPPDVAPEAEQEVIKTELDDGASSHGSGLWVAFFLIVVMGLLISGFVWFRRVRRRRRLDDEFLLTDQAFQPGGYSQLNDF